MEFVYDFGGLAVGVLMSASAALAQGYPERQVTLVVPFSAGGPTDTVGRLIAERMSADLGQQVIVENIVGAGGTLGAGNVASAEPDGYTILLHHIGMATSATLYRNLAYNTTEAFEYIGLVTEVPMTIVARNVSADTRAVAMSVRLMGNRLASFVNPLVFGMVAAVGGIPAAFVAAGILMLAFTAGLFAWWRLRGRAEFDAPSG